MAYYLKREGINNKLNQGENMRITNKKELTQKAISEALTDLCFLSMCQDTDTRNAKMVILEAQIKCMEQSLLMIK